MRYSAHKSGYTLLFAVIVAALVLGVAVFILSVARKQYILSSTARDSMFAIYAADSGIECGNVLLGVLDPSSPSGTVSCGKNLNIGVSFHDIGSQAGYSETKQTDEIGFELDNKECVKLQFTVRHKDSTDTYESILDSKGYNLCSGSNPDTTSPRTVERALRLMFY